MVKDIIVGIVKEIKSLPKVLIVGRVAWTKEESTLSGIFSDYPAHKLAYICIETSKPDFSRCKYHFQISEVAMIQKLFKWSVKTGNALTSEKAIINFDNEKQEKRLLHHVRAHRSIFYLYLRELLWLFGAWKSKELKKFIADTKPDVIFCVSDPLPLMNRLEHYVIKYAGKPAVLFLMDDVYSYTTCHNIQNRFYRWILRRQVIPLIKKCNTHFAISQKMKAECDVLFGTNCVLLTKGIERFANPLQKIHAPISIVYTGNLLYGRLETLAAIAKTIEKINILGQCKALLDIYTQTELYDDEKRQLLDIPGVSYLHEPVPYSSLAKIYEASDIVLFVESLEERYKYMARLSFSTKLTDYLACGRCIFAVGAEDIAPMEYLRDADIGILCTSIKEVDEKLTDLLLHRDKILLKAQKSLDYGRKNHSKQIMCERLNDYLKKACVE